MLAFSAIKKSVLDSKKQISFFIFPFFWGEDVLILCVTLYTTKHVFLTTKMEILERELFQDGYKQ